MGPKQLRGGPGPSEEPQQVGGRPSCSPGLCTVSGQGVGLRVRWGQRVWVWAQQLMGGRAYLRA